MKRAAPFAALALLLGSCGPQATPPADSLPAGFALKSATITLPSATIALPPSAELVTTNCTACHSPEMILSQPVLDAATWQKEIDKMRTAYRASIDPKDDRQLVAALVRLQETPATQR